MRGRLVPLDHGSLSGLGGVRGRIARRLGAVRDCGSCVYWMCHWHVQLRGEQPRV